MVTKKTGELRPCCDFRKLNEISVPDHFPCARIDTLIEKLGDAEFYSQVDCTGGFLQIPLTEEASFKCGITTDNQIYQFTRLPFGLRSATSIFNRTMQKVLFGLEENTLSYVDDISVHTKHGGFQGHLQALRKVFERFLLFNIKLSPHKCHFFQRKMTFLGHEIGKDSYSPAAVNVKTILDFPRPTNLKQARRYVGMLSFFRTFLPFFSTNIEPLTRLTKKDRKFEWGHDQETSFQWGKKAISEKPILQYPNYDKDFHIMVDSSGVAQGGVLLQLADNSKSRYNVIAYCSRMLSEAERNAPAVKNEVKGINFCLRTFRPHIFMSKVSVHTDHKPLTYIQGKTDAHPSLARWLIEWQNYDLEVVHIEGGKNKVADALSRAGEDTPLDELKNVPELNDIAEFPVCLACTPAKPIIVASDISSHVLLRISDDQNYLVDIVAEQRKDRFLGAIISYLEKGEIPCEVPEREHPEIILEAEQCVIGSDRTLRCKVNSLTKLKRQYATQPIVIPDSLKPLVFDYFHLSPLCGGHLNWRKTYQKCTKYYWRHMFRDVYSWCRACSSCLMRNNPSPLPRVPLHPVTNNTLFSRIYIDACGPFKTSANGMKHIVNICCAFTKYTISVAVPDLRSTTLARVLLNNCLLVYGCCSEIITDQARYFTSDFYRELCNLLYISKKFSTPYHSEGHGIVERAFRTYQNMLAKYVAADHRDFDEWLPFMSFCFNTSVHEATGESPFFLMFARDPIFHVQEIIDPKHSMPVVDADVGLFKATLIHALRDAWSLAYEHNQKRNREMKRQYDKHAKDTNICVGDRVMLQHTVVKPGLSRKFLLPWTGIFRVIGIEEPHAVIVSCVAPQAKPKRVHLNQLKKAFSLEGPACTVPPSMDPR